MGTSILNGIIIPNHKKPLIRIPSSIKNSMVLWYDISKQGATNESMAANPILKDLSGNGNDATCFNFAWSGMSGIGGYDFALTKFFRMDSGDFLSSSRYECNTAEGNPYILYTSGSTPHAAFKVKVSGLTQGIQYRYSPSADSETTATFNIPSDGEYEIPQSYANSNISTVGFLGRQAGLVIELVPLYPNALVSDGVDDYAYVEGLPLLTKERGFTVVCRRVILKDSMTMGVAGKSSDAWHDDGAFVFEGADSTNRFCQSWKSTLILDEFEPSEVSWLTSQSYNGNPITGSDNRIETDFLVLFRYHLNGNYSNIALYSFALFNRDLTTEEIEWVKTNLLWREESEFNEALVDGWIFNGTNDNFPDTIKGINGHEMVLYGFDGTAESGFNNGLYFDGVDDYTKVSGLPILDDFTVICHREILSDYYCVASKAEAWNTGAFILENSAMSSGGGRTYGALVGYLGIDKSEQTIYMTPTSYKGNSSVRTFNRGDNSDTEYLWLGRERDFGDYTKMNIKYILLYNKTLTNEEIQAEIEKAERRFNNN